MYAIGGVSLAGVLNTSERYNPENNTWEEATPMLFKHNGFGLHTNMAGDKIYAMGCSSHEGNDYNCEVYDVSNDKWTALPNMGVQRSWPASTMHDDGSIYVMGGGHHGKLYESAEKYDPKLNLWTSVPPLCERRIDAYSASIDNSIYVFGGYRKHGCPSMANVQKFCGTEVFHFQQTEEQRSEFTAAWRKKMCSKGNCPMFSPPKRQEGLWTTMPHDMYMCTII